MCIRDRSLSVCLCVCVFLSLSLSLSLSFASTKKLSSNRMLLFRLWNLPICWTAPCDLRTKKSETVDCRRSQKTKKKHTHKRLTERFFNQAKQDRTHFLERILFFEVTNNTETNNCCRLGSSRRSGTGTPDSCTHRSGRTQPVAAICSWL